MGHNDKSPEHHVAFGAAMDGFDAIVSSIAIIGRYWWNFQMRVLLATGTMGLFKAHWWLFLVIGFLLLALVMPLGVAFVLSAFCAGAMDPKPEDNFIVPLKHEEHNTASEPQEIVKEIVSADLPDDAPNHLMYVASFHHEGYLSSLGRDLNDKEFAAAALGAFEGTVKASDIELSDIEMHIHGASFVVSQLINLKRVEAHSIDPKWLAEITDAAMSAPEFEVIRTEAGYLAYVAEGGRVVPPPSTQD